MKKMLAAVAVAAAAVTGMATAAIPSTAEAQGYGRPYYGPHRGPGWHSYRRGYYGHYRRYPVRVCRTRPNGVTRCFYR